MHKLLEGHPYRKRKDWVSFDTLLLSVVDPMAESRNLARPVLIVALAMARHVL